MLDMEDAMLDALSPMDCSGLLRLGAKYSDVVIGANGGAVELRNLLGDNSEVDVIEDKKEKDYLDGYYNLYHALAG